MMQWKKIMTKEVMKQALEALRMPCEFWNKTQFIKVTEAIKALEEALKKEQDEPVAYINVEQRKLEWAKYTSWETPTVVNLPKIPLYTTLQTKEWVSLIETQIDKLEKEFIGFPVPNIYNFVQAIEAKLKKKNN